jgi:D-amino-acid dehydrogenase
VPGVLSSNPSPDVLVVGAGAIGAAAAYELARRGLRVTLLERSRTPEGCSHGNAGLICPSHAEALANPAAVRDGLRWLGRRDSPFHLRPRAALVPWLARFGAASLPARSAAATATLRALAAASLERHAALARAGLPTSFTRRGILSVFESGRGLPRGALTAEQARELEPGLAADLAGAVYHEGEAHCDPSAFVAALIDGAREHGAKVCGGVEILRLRRVNGRVSGLDTTDGPLGAGTVVLAAGSWTRALAREIGVHVPVEAAKGYHVEVDAAPLRSGIPIYMEEAHVIATPLGGRVRLAGTLELSGMDMRVDPIRVQALVGAAGRTLRLPAASRTVGVWRGLRPCAPDGLPVIGPVDGVSNLVLATAHAMLGITLAPVTGDIVASLVAGERPSHDVAPFAPSRFRRALTRTRT